MENYARALGIRGWKKNWDMTWEKPLAEVEKDWNLDELNEFPAYGCWNH